MDATRPEDLGKDAIEDAVADFTANESRSVFKWINMLHYILKPFNPMELKIRVKKIIEQTLPGSAGISLDLFFSGISRALQSGSTGSGGI